jgi:hypothetical protein
METPPATSLAANAQTVDAMRSPVVMPFTILIDQREQAPYSFDCLPPSSDTRNLPPIVHAKTTYLKTGDYQLAEVPGEWAAVERKSLEDLFSSLSPKGGRDRFRAEIERLSEFRFAAVVIEGTMLEICNPAKYREAWRSEFHGRAAFETISSWATRWPNVHWIPAGTRGLAEIVTFSLLEKAWRRWREKVEAEKKEEQQQEIPF